MVSERTVIAVNRFGYGARPGDLAEIGDDPAGWLREQLRDERAPAELAALPSTQDVLGELPSFRADIFAARQSGDAESLREAQRARGRFLNENAVHQNAARISAAISTSTPFRERLVHFWSNHFAVSAEKRPLQAIAGLFENEAIRPHLNGRFVDMLMAVEQHPGMILYLDNQSSTGPGSRVAAVARDRGREVGLNENLAREILELHTLSVDGGYTQRDVTEFAKVLTGWSVDALRGAASDRAATGLFRFRGGAHEPGSRALLGKRYAPLGLAQGESVLADLASHPSTARFIATKLARHFSTDDPPAALVDRLSRRYIETDGSLPELYAVLIESVEAWQEPFAKYKAPTEFLVSTYRALGRVPEDPQRLYASLRLLGQTPFTPGSPAGWGDTSADWDGGDALLRRIEWASAVVAQSASIDPRPLAEDLFGPLLSDHTRTSIHRAEDAAQGLLLLLASPEFMRR